MEEPFFLPTSCGVQCWNCLWQLSGWHGKWKRRYVNGISCAVSLYSNMLLWRIHFPWAQSEEELFRSAYSLSLPQVRQPAWPPKNTDAPEGRLLTFLDREWFVLSVQLHNQTHFTQPYGSHDRKYHSYRSAVPSSCSSSPFCLSHFAGRYVDSDYHKITWANDMRFGLLYIDQRGLQVTTEVDRVGRVKRCNLHHVLGFSPFP